MGDYFLDARYLNCFPLHDLIPSNAFSIIYFLYNFILFKKGSWITLTQCPLALTPVPETLEWILPEIAVLNFTQQFNTFWKFVKYTTECMSISIVRSLIMNRWSSDHLFVFSDHARSISSTQLCIDVFVLVRCIISRKNEL